MFVLHEKTVKEEKKNNKRYNVETNCTSIIMLSRNWLNTHIFKEILRNRATIVLMCGNFFSHSIAKNQVIYSCLLL